MLKKLSSIMAAALLVGTTVAQVTIPPHSSVYVGYSRGFAFVAATNFNIVQLELPLDAFTVGNTASFALRVNGTMAFHSFGTPGPSITCNVPILIGDIVDVIGNWSPAVPGNFTAANSYGNTAPYATTIEGVPHTLYRQGVQDDIGNPAWVPGVGFLTTGTPTTTGAIGRVLMYTSSGQVGTVFSTATPVGSGCVAQAASFYEMFASTPAMDLSNTAFRMLHTGTGYVVLPSTSAYVAPSATAVNMNLGDDTTGLVPLSASFPYPGGTTTSLEVCSNGFISVASGNGTSYAPTVSGQLSRPQTSWSVWHDFICNATGNVWYEEVAGVVYVTWLNVIGYAGTSPATIGSTFQLQFELGTGNVDFVFQSMDTVSINGWGADGYLVGYSPGGPSLDPGSSDLTTAVPAASILLVANDLPALALTTNGGRPIASSTLALTTNNLAPSTLFGAVLLGLNNPTLDLSPLGMAGCTQYSDGMVTLLYFTNGAPSVSTNFVVPSAILNVHVFAQAVAYDPASGLTTLGAIASNGIDMLIGDW